MSEAIWIKRVWSLALGKHRKAVMSQFKSVQLCLSVCSWCHLKFVHYFYYPSSTQSWSTCWVSLLQNGCNQGCFRFKFLGLGNICADYQSSILTLKIWNVPKTETFWTLILRIAWILDFQISDAQSVLRIIKPRASMSGLIFVSNVLGENLNDSSMVRKD